MKQSQNKRTGFDFDLIANRYDLANRMISQGRDIHWRRKLVSAMTMRPGLRMLDLATGTGDVAILAAEQFPDSGEITALDYSGKMLEIARKKAAGRKISFVQGDMQELAFAEGSFDCVSCVFGLRNVPDPARAIAEMYRVLSRGGEALILEFSLPRNPFARMFFGGYFRFIMPLLGGLITGNFRAYRYLYRSVRDFYQPEQLQEMFSQAGFEVSRESLAMSAVWLYKCCKK